MATFTGSDDLRGAEFTGVNLRGARFVEADLSGVVMRAVDVAGAEIDAPWLFEDKSSLLVNGVDVTPFVEAELNRRFPGRAERRAGDPAGLRAAWAAVERTWAATLERVAAMPAGTVDVSVGGEWSFAQTLRHLVMATDTWLGRTILGTGQPYHPFLTRSGSITASPSAISTRSRPSPAHELDAARYGGVTGAPGPDRGAGHARGRLGGGDPRVPRRPEAAPGGVVEEVAADRALPGQHRLDPVGVRADQHVAVQEIAVDQVPGPGVPGRPLSGSAPVH